MRVETRIFLNHLRTLLARKVLHDARDHLIDDLRSEYEREPSFIFRVTKALAIQ